MSYQPTSGTERVGAMTYWASYRLPSQMSPSGSFPATRHGRLPFEPRGSSVGSVDESGAVIVATEHERAPCHHPNRCRVEQEKIERCRFIPRLVCDNSKVLGDSITPREMLRPARKTCSAQKPASSTNNARPVIGPVGAIPRYSSSRAFWHAAPASSTPSSRVLHVARDVLPPCARGGLAGCPTLRPVVPPRALFARYDQVVVGFLREVAESE